MSIKSGEKRIFYLALQQEFNFGAAARFSPSHDMTLRISNIAQRPAPITITVDGDAVRACPGEMLAAALFAAGIRTLRYSPGKAQPRGMFCLMGVCQECLVQVNDRQALACQTPVREGMCVRTGKAD